MSEDTKQIMRPTQTETGYETLSSVAGKACANCRFFASMSEHGDPLPYCHLIENYPLDILPTGYCQRHEERPSMEIEPAPVPVVIVAEVETVGEMQLSTPVENVEGKAGRMVSSANASVLKRAWENAKESFSALTDILTKAGLFEENEAKAIAESGSAFTVFKGKDGKDYWRATWSNDFKDRDDEIITSAAHAAYLKRLDMGLVPLPDLYYWHMPLFKHGKALYVDRVGHMMIAFGEFDDTPLAKAFIQHYKKNKKKVSHGFKYPLWAKKDGVYTSYNTFEISPLPPDMAANLYTDFQEFTIMGLTDTQKAHMESILGKPLLDETLSKTAELSKALEGAGISFKDFAEVPDATALQTEGGEALLGKMLLALIESQGQLVAKQDADSKAFNEEIAALKTANKALEDKNKALEEKLGKTPRIASTSSATVVEDPSLMKEVQERVSDYDESWKALGLDHVPKNRNGVT